MEKLKKIIRSEIDVEFFACMHSMLMISVLGFELYLYGIKAMSYVTIFQIFVLSYIIAWFQKILFIKEKIYSKLEYKIRTILWNIGPIIITLITGKILHWYKGLPSFIEIVFIIIMLIYYIFVWWLLQIFYRDETKSLNNMLLKYKENHKEENEYGYNQDK